MMNWRQFLGVMVGILAAPLTAKAQLTVKAHRIGYLALGLRPVPGSNPTFDAFLQGLRDLAYVEGGNVALESATRWGRS